ncbi:MAG: SDR family oxidoreductase [Prochloraceae cyanobacterium]|nr:SDR family oxidoreductase [Prochloraceae cyanobacterium]
MNFTNKTVIITGASAGIGKVLAIKLAQQGANLVLAARNKTSLETTARECIQKGGQAIAVPTDVTNSEACQKLIEASLAAFGAIDCLVNNAGIGMSVRFDEIKDLSIFEKIMKVNYLGSVYCTYYALPHLKNSRGLLVAISSLTGKTGVPTRSGYAASKHALQGFFDSLRVELRGTGVDVLVVSPGFVATDIRQRILGADGTPVKATLDNEEQKAMSAEVCVDLILKAMSDRKRELVMTLKGKLGLWLKLLAPNLIDSIAANAVSSQNAKS